MTYDVIVIGGGPAGENAADYARRAGLSSVIVEQERLGGECSFWACVPSKVLLRPLDVLDDAVALGELRPSPARADPEQVFERRDRFVHNWRDDVGVEWAKRAGISVVRGIGRLDGERRVAVARHDGAEEVLEARHAVILAVGSHPSDPPIPGLVEAHGWGSRELTSLRRAPRSIAVLGGGVVAVEGAEILLGMGSERVTLIARGERLLERVEPFASDLVADSLRRRGVDVRLSTEVVAVARGADGVTVTCAGGGTVESDELLIALGRRPALEGLGLETVGLDPSEGVSVDDHLAVTDVEGDWLYAVGDANGRALLTHMGKYQGRIVGDVIAARAGGRTPPERGAYADRSAVPQVIFSTPQVASVGLTEAQARDAGADVESYELDIAVSGALITRDDYRGHAKLVVDAERETVIGATFAGPDVGELLHAATIAVVGELTLDRLWHAVPAFPTVSEVWLRLVEQWQQHRREAGAR